MDWLYEEFSKKISDKLVALRDAKNDMPYRVSGPGHDKKTSMGTKKPCRALLAPVIDIAREQEQHDLRIIKNIVSTSSSALHGAPLAPSATVTRS